MGLASRVKLGSDMEREFDGHRFSGKVLDRALGRRIWKAFQEANSTARNRTNN